MTDRYAIIGNPVGHSLSPATHEAFARATGQDIAYSRILAPLDAFKETVLKFRDGGGRGLSVTIPFKLEAWRLADAHDGYAREAGAVNTLRFDGKIVGHNTDGAGLVRDLKDNLGCGIRGKRVLLMGAGGASYGVMEPLLREQPESLVVANRTAEKAIALVGHFEKFQQLAVRGITVCPYPALAGMRFDIVINATAAGLADAMPPLPQDVFAPGALAYELLYGRVTRFMKFARAEGARVSDGLGMLVEQAAEAFYIWRDVRPETAPVIRALRQKAEG